MASQVQTNVASVYSTALRPSFIDEYITSVRNSFEVREKQLVQSSSTKVMSSKKIPGLKTLPDWEDYFEAESENDDSSIESEKEWVNVAESDSEPELVIDISKPEPAGLMQHGFPSASQGGKCSTTSLPLDPSAHHNLVCSDVFAALWRSGSSTARESGAPPSFKKLCESRSGWEEDDYSTPGQWESDRSMMDSDSDWVSDDVFVSESEYDQPMVKVESGFKVVSGLELDDYSSTSEMYEDQQLHCDTGVDINEPLKNDPLCAWEYADDIFQHMKTREEKFYLLPSILMGQPEITPDMRTILVDWMVEQQGSFHIYHDTLFLAGKLVDHYLMLKEVMKKDFQLVGATALLIACKFNEVDSHDIIIEEFVFVCAGAFTATEMKRREVEMLRTLDYDINIPIAYHFLRHYGMVANTDLYTQILALYICESSLQVYEFVSEKASLIAAAAMYLALRMMNLGGWTPTLRHYSNLSVQDLLPMAVRLNRMLSTPWPSEFTVRTKYSSEAYSKVARIRPLEDVEEDAKRFCYL